MSLFREKDRVPDFRKFVHDTLETIKPPVVVASGDLVDGRGKDFFVSEQYVDGKKTSSQLINKVLINKLLSIVEWKLYYDILMEAKVPNRTIWLDLRGNHGTNYTELLTAYGKKVFYNLSECDQLGVNYINSCVNFSFLR